MLSESVRCATAALGGRQQGQAGCRDEIPSQESLHVVSRFSSFWQIQWLSASQLSETTLSLEMVAQLPFVESPVIFTLRRKRIAALSV